MAFELSRVDRLTKTYDLAARFPDLDGPFTAAEVALLPPRSNPNGATLWDAVGVTAGIASVMFAGPDADSSGAVVVTGSADLWLRVTVGSEVDAAKVERITLLGSGTVIAPGPLPQVLTVQGRTGAVVLDADDVGALAPGDGAGGALSGTFPNPGLNASPVESIVVASDAVKAAYVPRADLYAPRRGVVSFTIDDGRADTAAFVTLHEALGQRVTLGIVSSLVGTTNYLTSSQILAYHQRGHEIANHSKTHANYTAITAAQRAVETDDCQTFLTSLLGAAPKTFIYPQGAWNATTERELCGRFRSWALTVSPTTSLPVPYPLGSTNPRFYRLDVQDPANLDRAKELIRLAAVAPIVVSTYIHYVDQPGTTTTAQYLELAQLAHDLGIPTVLPRDVIGSLSLVQNASFEATGTPNWASLNTGTATADAGTITPDPGLAGSRGLIITAANPDTGGRSQAVPVVPGKYRLSGRVKVASGNLVTNDYAIRLRYRAWDETALTFETFFPALSGVGTWARFEQDYTVPDGTAFALLDLMCIPNAAGRSGVLHVDHVDLRLTSQGGLG